MNRAADAFEGDRIVSRNGEDLGSIEDLMIDVQQGTVAYALMAPWNLPSPAERLLAIPWAALTLDPARLCFVLDTDKKRLEQAPGFPRNRWPSMADTRWASQVHEFYGVLPYWNERKTP
jgi:hypothetical protein